MAVGCFKSLILIAMLLLYLGIPVLLMLFGVRWLRRMHSVVARRLVEGGTAIAIMAAVLLLPLAIGVWLPDIVCPWSHVIAHAQTTSGEKFDVIQYWNGCDFYNTELIHTDVYGGKKRHVLDGDDAKSWSVPISVDETKKQVTVVLGGNRPRIIDYGDAQPATPPYSEPAAAGMRNDT